MPANYDNSASFYDKLSRLVFGDALKQAQVYLIPYIPSGSKVLLIGGGTGWILEEIAKVHPSGLTITYVEISAKMMALSKSRDVKENKVIFINKAAEELERYEAFDVVITPFLLDNYTDKDLPETFGHIHDMLRPAGLWLYTDFHLSGKWWQPALLKTMLLFFKLLCGVESWRLPDARSQFEKARYKQLDQKGFFGDFITSQVLVKPTL